MDSEIRNLQSDFFNAMRKDKSLVTVYLGNGKRLTGRLKSFDKFTLLLEGPHGDQMIFKHAISTVCLAAKGADSGASEARRESVGAAAPTLTQAD